jgi:hypothetical protein
MEMFTILDSILKQMKMRVKDTKLCLETRKNNCETSILLLPTNCFYNNKISIRKLRYALFSKSQKLCSKFNNTNGKGI